MISSNRKSQSSFEFVAITGIMFLIFIGVFIVIQSRMGSTRMTQLQGDLNEFSNLLETEVNLAHNSPGDYTRTFRLPGVINEFYYDISITAPEEIAIKILENEDVIFLNHNLSDGATIGPGNNRITKVDDLINITFLP